MIQYTIRSFKMDDIADINEIRLQPNVMRFTLATPTESIVTARKFFESLGPNDSIMVAEIEGKVVGVAGLHVMDGKRRHVGAVGISVHDKYQGKGIGKALMQSLLDIADNYLNLIRIELEVWSDNVIAIHLYESLGFKKEGVKEKYIFRNGGYHDAYMMARFK